MFGIGPQEMIVIGLLFLVVFGPSKLPSMARDLGRFVNEARGSLDEFRSEFVDDEDEDASDEDEDGHFSDEDETREQGEKEELALREEARATQAHAQTKQQP
jgi:Tat protein translocase TatB subunit